MQLVIEHSCSCFDMTYITTPSALAIVRTESFVSTKQCLDNFLLGTAIRAFQVEGAWNEGMREGANSNQLPISVKSYSILSNNIILKYV
ncbi:myrosinase 1-like [Aphis craccivora]|uniref:Myrosinase 1-like n=1 Tax=Aphis craccivora TaxID=307492 RepID=A0A6G0YNA6_APHCR|nr:myrosinase 1-like [Aphis craccivora]